MQFAPVHGPVRGWIAGVGSRETPDWAMEGLRLVINAYVARGYGVRTGDADKADAATRLAAKAAGAPLRVFSVSKAACTDTLCFKDLPAAIQRQALDLVTELHPAAAYLKPFPRLLHARNGNQILGEDLAEPCERIVLWAGRSELDEAGRLRNVAGGTGQAVRVAYARQIPAFNLDLPAHRAALEAELGLALPAPEVPQADVDLDPPQLRLFGQP